MSRCKFILEMNLQLVNIIGEMLTNQKVPLRVRVYGGGGASTSRVNFRNSMKCTLRNFYHKYFGNRDIRHFKSNLHITV